MGFFGFGRPKMERMVFDSSFSFFALWNHMEMLAMQAITQLSSRNELFHVGQLILVLRIEAYKSLKQVNKNLLFSLLYP